MPKQDKPRLGEWVRFSRYLSRYTVDDYDAAHEQGLRELNAKFVLNPNPDGPAMVVGTASIPVKARKGGEDELYSWYRGPRQTFYVLKRTMRGRFYVALEDIVREAEPHA